MYSNPKSPFCLCSLFLKCSASADTKGSKVCVGLSILICCLPKSPLFLFPFRWRLRQILLYFIAINHNPKQSSLVKNRSRIIRHLKKAHIYQKNLIQRCFTLLILALMKRFTEDITKPAFPALAKYHVITLYLPAVSTSSITGLLA